jgi:adenosine kinase
MAKQLLICGSIAIDRIMSFPGQYKELIHPDKLDVLSLSVLVDNLTITPGGIGPNIAHNVALLGEKPILLGAAGADAEFYLSQLAESGVDTSHVKSSRLPTASFTALTDADNNQVGGFYPGAMGDVADVSLQPWAGQDILFCLSAHDPAAMRRQVQECAEYGFTLFYDPGQQVSNVPGEDLRAGVEAAEIVAVNEYECDLLCQKTGLTYEQLATMVPIVISTRGEHGSRISGTAVPEPLEIASAKPGQVVDPTGAGDAYRAGFLYGYLRQWDLRKCGQLGTVLASFIIEHPGTQVEVSRLAIAQRYQETFNEEITL